MPAWMMANLQLRAGGKVQMNTIRDLPQGEQLLPRADKWRIR